MSCGMRWIKSCNWQNILALEFSANMREGWRCKMEWGRGVHTLCVGFCVCDIIHHHHHFIYSAMCIYAFVSWLIKFTCYSNATPWFNHINLRFASLCKQNISMYLIHIWQKRVLYVHISQCECIYVMHVYVVCLCISVDCRVDGMSTAECMQCIYIFKLINYCKTFHSSTQCAYPVWNYKIQHLSCEIFEHKTWFELHVQHDMTIMLVCFCFSYSCVLKIFRICYRKFDALFSFKWKMSTLQSNHNEIAKNTRTHSHRNKRKYSIAGFQCRKCFHNGTTTKLYIFILFEKNKTGAET